MEYNATDGQNQPTRLGSYILERKLGEGAHAVVYLAHDERLNRRVALKVLKPALTTDTQAIQRFLREGRAASELFHTHIATVLDMGESEGRHYIAERYIEGPTLAERLREKGKLPWTEALKVCAEIGSALEYAHQHGLVHRDVKPQNIMLHPRDGAVLTDFWLMWLLEETESLSLSLGGGLVGSIQYMAPEVLRGEKAVPASDQYALGCVLGEMLSGEPLFSGPNLPAVILRHTQPVDLSKVEIPGVPPSWKKILKKALAQEPQQRFESVTAFVQALHEPPRAAGRPTRVAAVPEPDLAAQPDAAETPETGVETNDLGLPTPPVSAVTPVLPAEIHPVQEPPDSTKPSGVPRMAEAVLGPTVVRPNPGEKPAKKSWWLWALGASLSLVILFMIAALLAGPGAKFTLSPFGFSTPVLTAAPTAVPTPRIGSTQVSEKDGMVQVFVPAGEFLMGSADSDSQGSDDEKPQHTVYLDAFWIDQTEVTNAMFTQFVRDTGYQTDGEKSGKGWVYDGSHWSEVSGADWRHPSGPSSSVEGIMDYPVVQVSWNDASAYCEWAGRRLPTEAEWEKAARGTDGRIYPWGSDDPTCELVNYSGCAGDTQTVGSHPAGASPYGALDMAGNVWEWTADWYQADYYLNSPLNNPHGPASGDGRVLRGGSLRNIARNIRSALRSLDIPDNHYSHLGFRCARFLTATATAQPNPTPEPVTMTPALGITHALISKIDGMKLVYVPAGEFLMGSAEGDSQTEDDEKPQHTVYLDAFWIDQTEVTNAMFTQFVRDTGYQTDGEKSGKGWVYDGSHWSEVSGADWRHPSGPSSSVEGIMDYPVVQVSWNDASAYCEWAGRRLPTEAEWEKAARGTDGQIYPWGSDDPTCELVNYSGCAGDTQTVGSHPAGASPYGAQDMAGNVWEWTADWYQVDYYLNSPLNNPHGPASGDGHVVRGGSWFNNSRGIRSAIRNGYDPVDHDNDLGFRCAR